MSIAKKLLLILSVCGFAAFAQEPPVSGGNEPATATHEDGGRAPAKKKSGKKKSGKKKHSKKKH